MSSPRASVAPEQAGVTLPRGLLIAEAWSRLGPAVAPLGNASGRPLARTVKLILDPLVLRPVLNPRFAAGAVDVAHAEELRDRIAAAGPVLAATAAWFLLVKKRRRKAGITEGNPQDLYFQRCFELATTLGDPGAGAVAEADELLADVHDRAGPTVAGLRDYVTDPVNVGALLRMLDAAWAALPAAGPDGGSVLPDRFLATCVTRPDAAVFAELVTDLAGSRGAADLHRPGVAAADGLTDRELPTRPELGAAASKNALPKPFDRSIVQRLFAPLTDAARRDALADVPDLVRREIARSAAPWQLGAEPGRVAMLLGRAAAAGLVGPPAAGAAAQLRTRWEREAYVHRARRMPGDGVHADVHGVREAYLRRLWVRLHGRELVDSTVVATEVWDLLDGVLRSVILDQRDRLRTALERLDERDGHG
ncbi:hypothetical protein V5P93_003554 [Actinokineospora auranticolor]|uniref:Uncharacterized protein n=1 Tax=Actinokineospora auranticolor TaxID=155976 RepID=A0A2S6GPU5_9PSEU|nr:hypothetical protein [Actinokineospora auranticolor]PPK67217.1 hypothetical protein CLV40_108215 [Actinokineospora auranticolor]